MDTIRKYLPVLMIVLSACSPMAAIIEPTNTPTIKSSPTASATSTATITPTASQTPTETPLPTATPNPLGIDWAINCEDDEMTNGYWFHDLCLPGIVSEEFHRSPGPQHYVGISTYYAEGKMERVAEVRGMSMNGYWGGIATMFCGNIGKSAYLKPFPEGHWQGPYLVLDCSGREHLYYNIMLNEIALEVDWNTYQRWGGSGGGIVGVHVCLTYPDCGAAVTLPSWFTRFVEWERLTDE